MVELGDIEITKREILVSISIIAIMMLIGFLIFGKISEHQMDKNEQYNKAVKIKNDREQFEYGMRTNVGNTFVYGDLDAVDTVSYDRIAGKFIYIKEIKEKYTRHTRQVTHTRTVNGKTETYYTTETYWTWDIVDSHSKKSKEITFCGVKFSINKINIPNSKYIKTVNDGVNIRYVYYGTKTHFTGTIYTKLKDKTISDKSSFYEMNIEQTMKYLKACGSGSLIGFWIFWIFLIAGCVYGFYYLDNEWLE